MPSLGANCPLVAEFLCELFERHLRNAGGVLAQRVHDERLDMQRGQQGERFIYQPREGSGQTALPQAFRVDAH